MSPTLQGWRRATLSPLLGADGRRAQAKPLLPPSDALVCSRSGFLPSSPCFVGVPLTLQDRESRALHPAIPAVLDPRDNRVLSHLPSLGSHPEATLCPRWGLLPWSLPGEQGSGRGVPRPLALREGPTHPATQTRGSAPFSCPSLVAKGEQHVPAWALRLHHRHLRNQAGGDAREQRPQQARVRSPSLPRHRSFFIPMGDLGAVRQSHPDASRPVRYGFHTSPLLCAVRDTDPSSVPVPHRLCAVQ